jgi:hypothetical protein
MRGDDRGEALTELEAALVAASKASELLTAALERAAAALADGAATRSCHAEKG